MLEKVLTLTRTEFSSQGIFGMLIDDSHTILLNTLEHAYAQTQGLMSHSTSWSPKIPAGKYTCIRGMHALGNLIPFETFEITKVPGHTGCLIHPGNSEADSEGCVLLGMLRQGGYILSSRKAFSEFMKSVEGLEQFTLEIT